MTCLTGTFGEGTVLWEVLGTAEERLVTALTQALPTRKEKLRRATVRSMTPAAVAHSDGRMHHRHSRSSSNSSVAVAAELVLVVNQQRGVWGSMGVMALPTLSAGRLVNDSFSGCPRVVVARNAKSSWWLDQEV